MGVHPSVALFDAATRSRSALMWQENHLSLHDEVWNMIGCLFMFLSAIAVVIIGMRYVSSGVQRKLKT